VRGQPENGAPTRTQCFDYDALNRLSQAWTATDGCAAAPSPSTIGGVDSYWTSWEINSIGLRRAEVKHAIAGGADTTTTYNYPQSGSDAVRPHAVTSTITDGPLSDTSANYEYNAAGSVTNRGLPTGAQALTWDDNNRLASVTTETGTTGYLYDADGAQLIRTDPDTTTLYLPMQDIVRDNTTGALKGARY
jgi:YD repeat-containing protein